MRFDKRSEPVDLEIAARCAELLLARIKQYASPVTK
jgi:hypothetical protein